MLHRSDIYQIDKHSPAYPKEWLSLPDAPEKVYAIGNIALLGARKLTVVGSRKTPPQANKLTAEIAQELSTSFAVVTGVAEGGDSAVIDGALLGTGDIICVLAGGFSSLPQGNLQRIERVADRGLILSPYPFEATVRSFSYEYRNKLLATLGEGVFVVGAGEKSGTLITAKYAKSLKKPVFALPYTPWATAGKGCNALIKDGATLVENARDILQVFGIERKEKSTPVLIGDELRVYENIRDAGDIHATALAEQTGIPVFKLRAILASLEVKGVVVAIGGNRYSAV